MPHTTTASEVQERAFLQSLNGALLGLAILVVAGILFYFMKFWLVDPMLMYGRLVMGIAMLAGAGIAGTAVYHGALNRNVAGVDFTCPYCDKVMKLVTAPSDDFECEHCSRTIHMQNGTHVQVREVTCQACRSSHRVAITSQHYICDNCNRPLKLAWVKDEPKTGTGERGDMMQNYDVLLIAFDRRHENELAFKLQNLLVCNLNEARKQLATASAQTPLTVAHDVPQRKAEAVRRQLQELGGTATLRAAMSGMPAGRNQ
jgi:hypothetical protein